MARKVHRGNPGPRERRLRPSVAPRLPHWRQNTSKRLAFSIAFTPSQLCRKTNGWEPDGAFGALSDVLNDYESFVTSFLNIQDSRVKEKVDGEIADGLLWPEPWLALNPSFESGGAISDLVGEGLRRQT